MVPLINYWKDYRVAFKNALEPLSDNDFIEAWKSSSDRTNLYENTIIEKVANELQLIFKKEDFKIDYTLCIKNDDEYEVPLIYIESENNANSAS